MSLAYNQVVELVEAAQIRFNNLLGRYSPNPAGELQLQLKTTFGGGFQIAKVEVAVVGRQRDDQGKKVDTDVVVTPVIFAKQSNTHLNEARFTRESVIGAVRSAFKAIRPAEQAPVC